MFFKQKLSKINIANEDVLSLGLTGSMYKGNYVWGIAMNLAWNDLIDNIIKEKIILSSTPNNKKLQNALKIAKLFNEGKYTKNDLDEKSYYIKSGYGQKTVDEINIESKAKFPQKSFEKLRIVLGDKDIIAYAYFFKELKYAAAFLEEDVKFKNEWVKGFISDDGEQNEYIKEIEYINDNKFIISLDLEDPEDQLILATGYNMKTPDEVLSIVNNTDHFRSINPIDTFYAPNISLDLYSSYDDMIGQKIANKKFDLYEIGIMYEKIKFDMDNKGVKVENEAVIGIMLTMGIPDREKYVMPKPRHFHLDQPYWIILKMKNSSNPYFVLGVYNSELMSKAK